jgi:hypothetical protein
VTSNSFTPPDVIGLQAAPHVLFEPTVVVLVLLPHVDDEVEVVPHVAVLGDMCLEAVGLQGGAVEDVFVDAAEKALLSGVDQALDLLVPQVAEGVDDDSEHDIEEHDQDHQEEEHVHGVAGPEGVLHLLAHTVRGTTSRSAQRTGSTSQSVEQSFFVSPSSMSPRKL